MRRIRRIESIDFLRGTVMMLIVLLHGAVYNFANIHKIDFTNPPLIIIAVSFLVLWGGSMLIYSGIVNTMKICERKAKPKEIKFLFVAGLAYLVLHFVLNIVLGRWNVDLVNNRPVMSMAAASIRNMSLTFPEITKFFEGSALSIIALNLIIISAILYILLRKNNDVDHSRNYWILGGAGFTIMLLSFVRVYWFRFFSGAVEQKNYLLAGILSFVIANPYSLIPYLAYGLFASMIGLMVYNKRSDLLKKALIPLGAFFLAYGVIGAMNFQKTISKPDFFWYFKTNFELGIFLLVVAGILILLKDRKFARFGFIKNFSRVSLTVYLLETTLSELMSKVFTLFIPGWNQTINGALIFGGFNILIWIAILALWKRNGFKYSLEYFWIKFFDRLGKKSTKLDST